MTTTPERLVSQQGAGFREGRPKPFRTVDEPAFTVHGGSKSGEGGGVRHRWECSDGSSRPLSLSEYGVLQSFPSAYPWQGPVSSSRLQAGNAVPPLLAHAVLSAVTQEYPMSITADDLFAGAGGWDLAAEALGIHARGVENMKEARLTRDAAGLTTIHDDVWTFTPDGRATGLIASPPCQTFSAAGKGSGRKALDDVLAVIGSGDWHSLAKLKEAGLRFGDDRTALVLTPLHFATGYEYEWLAWEQVPTVLPVWEACAEVLREFGWHVWTGLLQAEMYGVPQTRKRAFLLASRLGPVELPKPTHSRYYSRSPEKLDEGVEKWVSMAEALGWGLGQRPSPTVTEGGTETGGAEPIAKLARYTDREDWAMGTTNVKDGEYQSRPVGEPAPTITAVSRSFRWGQAPLLVTTPGVKGGNMQENRVTADEFPSHMGDVYNSKGCIRSTDEPAPTMTASMDNGNFRWHDRDGWTFRTDGQEKATRRPLDEPAPTIKGGHGAPYETGLYAPDHDTSARPARASVRVSVAEAGVLQSFPADYPWQGNKGKQYLQCGNAVPPGLAWHALQAAAVHHLSSQQIEGVA